MSCAPSTIHSSSHLSTHPSILGLEPRTSRMLGKYSTTKRSLQPFYLKRRAATKLPRMTWAHSVGHMDLEFEIPGPDSLSSWEIGCATRPHSWASCSVSTSGRGRPQIDGKLTVSHGARRAHEARSRAAVEERNSLLNFDPRSWGWLPLTSQPPWQDLKCQALLFTIKRFESISFPPYPDHTLSSHCLSIEFIFFRKQC